MKRISIFKRLLILVLVFILSINSFAAIVSDNDGATFITKAEFDSLKNNFQAQIDNYNTSIDSKIEGAIASYLAGIKVATVYDIDNKYELNKCTGATKILWSNITNEKNYTKSTIPCGATHVTWQWFEAIATSDATEKNNHKLEVSRGEEFFKKDFWCIDANGNIDGVYNESVYTDNVVTMIFTNNNPSYYGAHNFDAATSTTQNSIPVNLKKREKGATFPMIVNLGNYVHGGSFSYREEETAISFDTILRPLDGATNYFWERYGLGGQPLTVPTFQRSSVAHFDAGHVRDDVTTKANMETGANDALAFKGYDTEGYVANVDYYSYRNATDDQKNKWFAGIRQIRGGSFYEDNDVPVYYLGHVAHISGITKGKTVNTLSMKNVYDYYKKSWPISCGAIIAQNTVNNGKLSISFKVDKKAWVMLYSAADPDIKWGPLGRSSESGTEYKRAENYINASNVNVMQVRELDSTKYDYIAIVVIPETSGDLAELTIDKITLKVEG